jgi:hypothetical protein
MLTLGVVGGWAGYVIQRLLAAVSLVVVPCKVAHSVVVASSFLERQSALLLLRLSVSCACANRLGLPRL